MKIVSPFHDYYDTARRYYGDDGSLYVRKTEKCPLTVANALLPEVDVRREERHGRFYRADIAPFAIIFCGKTYRGLHVSITNKDYQTKSDHCWYDIESVTANLLDYGIIFDNREKKRAYRKWAAFLKRKTVVDFIEEPVNDLYAKLALDHRLPIIGINYPEPAFGDNEKPVTAHCILNKAEFFRVFDANTAYQELSMYVDGVLPAQDAMMATVSDKDRIAQRGFDKWSFRKMPTKARK